MKLSSLRSRADVTTNTGLFCIRNISKTMQSSGKKHAEHSLTHVNKTACEIWSKEPFGVDFVEIGSSVN